MQACARPLKRVLARAQHWLVLTGEWVGELVRARAHAVVKRSPREKAWGLCTVIVFVPCADTPALNLNLYLTHWLHLFDHLVLN